MPYKVIPIDGFVHVQWHGMLQAEDLASLACELPQIGKMLGYAPHVLHTFNGMTGTRIKPWSLLQHALRRRDMRLPNPVKIAWVAVNADVRRMGELFRELNRNPSITIDVFDRRATAEKWLQVARKSARRSEQSSSG